MSEVIENITFSPCKNGVMAIVSGELVSVFRVSLPNVSDAKLLKILPNIMADYVGSNNDEAHFAVLSICEGGDYLVAVCDKNVMHAVSRAAQEDGVQVKAVWPDYMTLPIADSGANILMEDDKILCRNSDGTGFTVSADIFPAFNITDSTKVSSSDRQAPVGAGLAVGAYNSRLPIKTYVKPLKRAAVLAVAMFILWLVSSALAIQENKQQRFAYQDAQIKIFKEAFPQVRRIVDVESQLNSLVRTAKVAGAGSILPMIDKVFGIMQRTGGIRLEALRYDLQDGQTFLLLTTASPDFGLADQLKANLQQAGLIVEDKGGRQDGDTVYNDFNLSEEK